MFLQKAFSILRGHNVCREAMTSLSKGKYSASSINMCLPLASWEGLNTHGPFYLDPYALSMQLHFNPFAGLKTLLL